MHPSKAFPLSHAAVKETLHDERADARHIGRGTRKHQRSGGIEPPAAGEAELPCNEGLDRKGGPHAPRVAQAGSPSTGMARGSKVPASGRLEPG